MKVCSEGNHIIVFDENRLGFDPFVAPCPLCKANKWIEDLEREIKELKEEALRQACVTHFMAK